MIDGLMRNNIDPLWERMAQPLARAGMTPNQVTASGLVLIVIACAAYLWHQSGLIFGLSLAVAFAFDALDGAVARLRDMRSKAGGYFDAMVDRYQELAVLAAIAWINDLWALALLGFSGGVLTSYAKARTALEIPVGNDSWPDLFERMERIVFLCVLLAVDGIAEMIGAGSHLILVVGLSVYALLTHLTAAQRINRAFAMLRQADAERRKGS